MNHPDFNELDKKGIELPLEERVGRHRGFPKSNPGPVVTPRISTTPPAGFFPGFDSDQI